MLTNRAFQRRQRGASLVELALVLFILLLILAGIVDFGRVFNHYVVITNASREGARYASINAPTSEDLTKDPNSLEAYREGILRAVQAEVVGSSIDPEQLDVETNPDLAEDTVLSGTPITVTVRYTVPTIIADIANFGYLPLRAQTSMVVFGLDE